MLMEEEAGKQASGNFTSSDFVIRKEEFEKFQKMYQNLLKSYTDLNERYIEERSVFHQQIASQSNERQQLISSISMLTKEFNDIKRELAEVKAQSSKKRKFSEMQSGNMDVMNDDKFYVHNDSPSTFSIMKLEPSQGTVGEILFTKVIVSSNSFVGEPRDLAVVITDSLTFQSKMVPLNFNSTNGVQSFILPLGWYEEPRSIMVQLQDVRTMQCTSSQIFTVCDSNSPGFKSLMKEGQSETLLQDFLRMDIPDESPLFHDAQRSFF